MLAEIREPKKGRGVPRQTRAANSIAALQTALERGYPHINWEGLPGLLEERGFFEAGMQQQLHQMAQAAFDMLGSARAGADLVIALASSPDEKVRGISALAIPLVYPGQPAFQIQALRYTGGLQGTWPRELSNDVLHGLIIQHGVSRVLPYVQSWIHSALPAIRRLVIESFRPRGVMQPHIVELKHNPTPLKSLLEPVLDDPDLYVRKAVANNLNDVSRDNPDHALKWSGFWLAQNPSAARRWVLERALRSLVKRYHPDALALLGYAEAEALAADWLHGPDESVVINQLLPFEFEVYNRGTDEARVLLLLELDEPGKNQSRRASRYQLWKGSVPVGASRRVHKQIHFVDKARRPKLPGRYQLTVVLNGDVVEQRSMVYQTPSSE
jgi:3-methyladenine DNA glycosylase AlkC